MENTFIPHTLDTPLSHGQIGYLELDLYHEQKADTVGLSINSPFNSFLKRFTDIVVSLAIVLIVLTWLIPLIAIFIKITSKGPVFFIQKRNSKYGKVFSCLKLRTMIVNEDSDILPAQLRDES